MYFKINGYNEKECFKFLKGYENNIYKSVGDNIGFYELDNGDIITLVDKNNMTYENNKGVIYDKLYLIDNDCEIFLGFIKFIGGTFND